MTTDTLPDFLNLLQLSKSLWRVDHQRRGAALLVGAGFSRLADLATAETPPPPLWNDLATTMLAKLYPETAGGYPTPDPLRIAEEFRAYLGQEALDDLLENEVADGDWHPSDFHRRAMSLPWSDVLTTNFDTLIERAAVDGEGPSYDIVAGVQDLVSARSPRIIKLHGTVGKGRLIIAEDDYRKYPIDFAPFVNTARQIFIENDLCLLGFSGTDPNFLQWSGWVRDNLVGNQRRIYLVGALGLAASTRALLESRGIAPIDLAPLVTRKQGVERHREAISQFLRYLERSRPMPGHDWIVVDESRVPAKSSDERRTSHDEELKSRIINRTNRWRDEREAYPGWLVCPPRKRSEVRMATANAAWDISRSKNLLTEAELSSAVIELVWRYETALWEIPEELVHLVKVVSSSQITTLDERSRLMCVLLRIARERGDEVIFVDTAARLRALTPSHDVLTEVVYQECLRLRDCLQWSRLEKQLENLNNPDPVWWLRKAALLAELRRWDAARSQIRAAALELRKLERKNGASIAAKSRRAWAVWLYTCDWRGSKSELWPARLLEDFSALDVKLQCDPWQEHQYLREAVAEKRIELEREAAGRYVPSFEPGRYTDNTSTERFVSHAVASPAYEVQRVAEVVGVPVNFDHTTLLPMAIEAVCTRPQASSLWYARLLRHLRSPKDEALRGLTLSRAGVALLPAQLAGELARTLMSVVHYWRNRAIDCFDDKPSWGGAIDALNTATWMLSRLSVRQDTSLARELFELSLMLGSTARLRHHYLYEAIDDLAKNSAEVLGKVTDGPLVLGALEHPLCAEVNEALDELWPTPLDHLRIAPGIDVTPLQPRWSRRVKSLVAACSTSGKAREEAAARLATVHAAGLLTEQEEINFSVSLWSQRSANPGSLPTGTRFYKHVFLDLPAPPDVNRKLAVASALLPDFLQLPEQLDQLDELWRLARRDDRQLLVDADKAVAWFDSLASSTPSSWVETKPGFITATRKSHRRQLGGVLTHMLVPAMLPEDLTQARGEKLVAMCSKSGVVEVLRGMVRFAEVNESMRLVVEEQIRGAIFSREWESVAFAAEAAAAWVRSEVLATCRDQTARIVDALVSTVQLNREAGLIDALHYAMDVVATDAAGVAQEVRLARAICFAFNAWSYESVEPLTRSAAIVSLVRGECARLARSLAARPSCAGMPELQSIVIAAANDPLPEVRCAVA